MALETLKGITEIGGYPVLAERIKDENGEVDWQATDVERRLKPIFIDHEVNMISFRIQDGPIKENGVNGCQVDTLIAAAYHIVGKLNEKFPCNENRMCINHLGLAFSALEKRTKDRETRGVEGTSKA